MSVFGKQRNRLLFRELLLYAKFRRSGSFHSSALNCSNIKEDVKEAASTSPHDDDESDSKFFKRLGKTSNHFWVDNAQEVFDRLEWKRLLEPTAAFVGSLRRRGCTGNDHQVDLGKIGRLWEELEKISKEEVEKRKALKEKLVTMALWVPNDTHEASLAMEGDVPMSIKTNGTKTSKKVEEFQKVRLQVYI